MYPIISTRHGRVNLRRPRRPDIFFGKEPSNMLEASLKEECGVSGVFGHRDAAHLVYLGLTSLQHRGQESAGIVSFNGRMNRHAGMGLVFDVFKKEHFNALRGHSAIGHVRYSTHGSSIIKN